MSRLSSTSSSIVVSMFVEVVLVERLHPAAPLADAQRGRVGVERQAPAVRIERRGPFGDVDQQVVAGLGNRARP